MAALTREKAVAQLETRPAGFDTICAVHRRLWRLLGALPERQRIEARDVLVTAYVMGSKMQAKLVEYKDAELARLNKR